ncbi:hypothetical protein PsorP6_012431 [Peronosclerospora sorghi]|uniref:Uncharacterized protein n=1 Tax=Peronosclerospora sorghi TaxID=230839 RepID=A0ACC0WGD9_9STRA|nr:hypothetical protein PsorP6_012431 [Peronosclerospora sorghi]
MLALNYYTYRLGQNKQGHLEEDPRLSTLDKSWFEENRGLDIGCNSGEFTITIAKRLAPRYLLGVDVDPLLISLARGHLKDILRQENMEKPGREMPTLDPTTARCRDQEAESVPDMSKEGGSCDKVEEEEITTHHTVRLETSDTGASAPDMALLTKGKGTVPRAIGKTCVGVTKWIHLFHGDEGIKKVFAKIYELLTPGGRFILEPQPWKSYHKRKFTSEITAANYSKIQLRPKDFPKYLIDTIGFRSCDFLEVCRTSSRGFRRPVYVAQK